MGRLWKTFSLVRGAFFRRVRVVFVFLLLFCLFMAYLPELALPGMTLTQFVTFLVINNGNSFKAGFEVILPPIFFLTV